MPKAKSKKDELLQTPIPVERHDLSNGRWYTPVDEWWFEHYSEDTPKIYKRSSTTVESVVSKGYGFDKWLGKSPTYEHAMEYANKRAMIGTIVHSDVEQLLLGEEIDMSMDWLDHDGKMYKRTDEMAKYLMSFIKFTEDVEYETEALEICMFDLAADNEGNQLHPWAGTADWIVKITNKKGISERWLVDWKTGNDYPIHQLQLTSYQMLFESMFPDLKIDGIGCLYLKSGWRKEPNYKFKKFKFIPKTWNKVMDVSLWSENNPVPKFRRELPLSFSLKQVQEVKESA